MIRIPTTDEINRLVGANAAESMTLEFKGAPWGRSDGDKKECLKDITALANTRGGVILIGVTEQNNAATGLAALAVADAEAERSRINDLIVTGVQPRLYGVSVEPVAVEQGVVLAIAVPRSASRPHRVTTQNSNRFWLRNSTRAYEADVADLKALFLQGAEISERALRWHDERRARLRTGDIVQNIASGANGIVMHLIPADAFAAPTAVNLKAAAQTLQSWWPMQASSFNHAYSFDGLLAYRSGDPCHGYTLVQRNGIVEAVKVGFFDPANGVIYAKRLEGMLVGYARRYVAALYDLGVVPPVFALVTLEGVHGASIATDGYFLDGAAITRDDLTLPVAVIEDVSSHSSVGTSFRAAFDALWNAGGLEGSPQFDAAENWIGVVPD